jgi:hypothetical protein
MLLASSFLPIKILLMLNITASNTRVLSVIVLGEVITEFGVLVLRRIAHRKFRSLPPTRLDAIVSDPHPCIQL